MCTTYLNNQWFYILSTKCIYEFRMILKSKQQLSAHTALTNTSSELTSNPF
jgi:hypothetical protein